MWSVTVPRRLTWYFDFISPFAWLQAEDLRTLPADVLVECKPVLFASLLQHWGQLGPAEIAPKRRFTYRYIYWRAAKKGLPAKLPHAHPFNPLKLLRLATALNAHLPVVQRLFRFVWSEGHLPDDEPAWRALVAELGIADADERIADPAVKDRLRRNGEEAIAAGVFGVPTIVVDGELFWGADATEMLTDYLQADPLFASVEMRRADTLPIAQARKQD
jgi:2-hydroxychromene-2-carboxylate isomerase